MMCRLFRIRFFCVFAVTAIFTGCITFHFPPPPGPLPDPTDHSFPITGEVLAAGNIASVIERRGPFSRTRPLPQADVLLTGVVLQPFLGGGQGIVLRTITLRYQYDETIWLLPATRGRYLWRGTVAVGDNSVDTEIAFDVHASQRGEGKQFILTNALLGQVRLEADDPLEVYNSTTGSFPFPIGVIHLGNNRYPIIAVIDNVLYDRSGLLKDIFFDPLQKFQFLDGENAVVAELQTGRYTIYDTLPKEELEGMKQAIALFVAYRHSITVLRDIEDGWNLPGFFRFVYP
ncbi:MAG: hypothetical protein FWC64_08795 [Treponema sp.]|nr:hypothetical protein [Treponema sp.]